MGLKQNFKLTLCGNMSMDVTPYVYLFCFQQLSVSIGMIVIFFYQSSSLLSFYLLLFVMGVHNFCSNGPHFGHGVNYYVSKYIAEHILKHSELLFIRNTIRKSRYSFSQKSHFMRNEI